MTLIVMRLYEVMPVTPETINSFSAIGYFFSKKIYDKYKIPIGLLFTAMGGTPAEAWISEDTITRFDRFNEIVQKCKQDPMLRMCRKRRMNIITSGILKFLSRRRLR